jgi:UDP-N-acetylglucosamine:LPS N-acetylglucosamine transferase
LIEVKKKILISTGGSGGHVIPATILYEHLYEKNDIIISTDNRGFRYLDNNVYKTLLIDTPKLNLLSLPLNFFKILFLIIKSILFLKKEKINFLFSTGGYMSLPLILAGKFLNLKIYLLEPNLVLGKANKFFLSSCKKIFCYTKQIKNFPEEYKNKKVIINPLVRNEFYKTKNLKINNDKFHLLVVGGSQGASIFDKNLKKSILNISKKFSIKVIQQTHLNNLSSLKEFYAKNNGGV